MEATDFQKCGMYGSMMLKRAFSVNNKSDPYIYKDPVWTDIVEGKVEDEEMMSSNYLVVSTQEEGGEFGVKEVR